MAPFSNLLVTVLREWLNEILPMFVVVSSPSENTIRFRSTNVSGSVDHRFEPPVSGSPPNVVQSAAEFIWGVLESAQDQVIKDLHASWPGPPGGTCPSTDVRVSADGVVEAGYSLADEWVLRMPEFALGVGGGEILRLV